MTLIDIRPIHRIEGVFSVQHMLVSTLT